MSLWIRFERAGSTGFGTLEDDTIRIHRGDMFAGAVPTGAAVARSDVRVLTPCTPTKMVALWNNFHALAAKLGNPVPRFISSKPTMPFWSTGPPYASLCTTTAR